MYAAPMSFINWDSEENAKKYRQYCDSNTLYRKAAESLCSLVNLKDNDVILDYACGTGASTEALVDVSNNTNTIYAVDYSAAQIEEAKKKLWPDNVSFHVGDEQSLPDIITKEVDVILCSNAFWFLDVPQFLDSLDRIGSSQCRLAFTMFGDPLPRKAIENEKKSSETGLLDIAKDYAKEHFGYETPAVAPADAWYEKTLEDYVEFFENSNFRITCMKARNGKFAPIPSGDAWFEIPVFLTAHMPNLEYEKALQALRFARKKQQSSSKEKIETAKPVIRYSWIYLAERV